MSNAAGNPGALRAHKTDSLNKTRKELELAVRRIVNGNPRRVKDGTPLSPASVAKEADIERSTLYRYHEPVLTEIRRITDSASQKKLKEKHSELEETRIRAKEYRSLLEHEQANLAKMARQNYALKLQIKDLEDQLRDRNRVIAELQDPASRKVVLLKSS